MLPELWRRTDAVAMAPTEIVLNTTDEGETDRMGSALTDACRQVSNITATLTRANVLTLVRSKRAIFG